LREILVTFPKGWFVKGGKNRGKITPKNKGKKPGILGVKIGVKYPEIGVKIGVKMGYNFVKNGGYFRGVTPAYYVFCVRVDFLL